MVRHFSCGKFDRIIFSIGCGSCEIELQACDSDLVVCLDKNRRSLFSASFNSSLSHRKNLIISHYDMKNSITTMLQQVYASTKAKMTILFQHPSPSTDPTNRQAIQSVGLDCITCLLSGVAHSIHFVFDHFKGRNCWTKASLLQEFVQRCTTKTIKDALITSDASIVSKKGSLTVTHPVFGLISRVGWASMKKGDEVAFHISSIH